MNDLSSQIGRLAASMPKARVAVFVDGDNVPHATMTEIERKADALGEISIRRVYGDMGLHKDWAAETRYLTIHCTTTAGKNRADMHLVIGALDIAHRGLATHFLIISDDRDFGPLVAYLREIGMRVEWAGKPKPIIRKVPTITVAPKVDPLTALDQRIRGLWARQRAGLTLVQIGNAMKGQSVKTQTGKSSWRAYLQSRPGLYDLTGEGRVTIVTLKVPEPTSPLPPPIIPLS